jgi:hypothetical protein
MAKQTVTSLIDDLDGGPADSTVRLGLDGVEVDIDLSATNEHELRVKLGPYLEAARRVRVDTRRGRAQARAAVSNKDRNQAVRAWAFAEGVELPSRGRIAGGVLAAYDNKDVDALFAVVGLERQQEEAAPKRSRRKISEAAFSETR